MCPGPAYAGPGHIVSGHYNRILVIRRLVAVVFGTALLAACAVPTPEPTATPPPAPPKPAAPELGLIGAKAAEFEDWVRSSRLAPGADGILVPGDPERASRKARAAGLVIDAQTLAQLDEAAAQISASLAPLSSLRG